MTYAIKILDSSNMIVGEMLTASKSQVEQFINKGMKVIDIHTNSELTISDLISDSVGVSDGLIN